MSDEAATKEHGGEEYDAIETLKPGEGVFPLQYGDPLAILPVRLWARLARRVGLFAAKPADREKYLRKATMAEAAVWDMIEYQKGQAPVAGRRASYNDQPAVDFGDQVKARKALIANASALHNAVGIAKTVEEALAAAGVHVPEQQTILGAITQLQAVAVAIDPRRDNERT